MKNQKNFDKMLEARQYFDLDSRPYFLSSDGISSCKAKRLQPLTAIGTTQTCGTFLRLLEIHPIRKTGRSKTGRLFCYLHTGRPIRQHTTESGK
ncbi:TPA: hypothetical protein ACFM6X_000251 [Neisseria meningitidis]